MVLIFRYHFLLLFLIGNHLRYAAIEPHVHEAAQPAEVHGTGGWDVEHDIDEVVEGAVGTLLTRPCTAAIPFIFI